MNLQRITDRIEYLPASENPLSADVVIVHGDTKEFVFDVGASDEAAELIQSLSKDKCIVLSHFHADHTTNTGRITYESLYCGDFAAKKFADATAVTSPVSLEDGVKIMLFPIPSTHAKGSVGMLVNEEYAFLGDSTYCTWINGSPAYNAGKLQALIKTLEGVDARFFCLSHERELVKEKAAVLNELKEIYRNRDSHNPYIYMSND